MAGFKTVGAWADCYEQGRMSYMNFMKTPATSVTNFTWSDLSMGSGFPRVQYYASSPLEAAYMDETRGIYHGDDKAPAHKYISNLSITSALTNSLKITAIVLDYLLYYPFIDGGVTGAPQEFINTVSLPRYTDGAGVQAMLVAQSAGLSLAGSFTMDYINQDGDLKTSPTVTTGEVTAVGTIVTDGGSTGTVAKNGPFIPLASGDTGIRSVVSITLNTAVTGLYSLVLVRPLLTTYIGETQSTAEKNVLKDTKMLPRVYDGAYLNFIISANSQFNTVSLTGYLNFIWSEA